MLPKENVRHFFWYINERQRILLKQRAGDPWPWTSDPILQKYRFCNVNREDDKVTIWIRKNWREPYSQHRNLWFAMSIARQINWPDTLAAIGFPTIWDPDKVATIMRERRRQSIKLYTGAYMIPGSGSPDKIQYTVYEVLDPLFKDPPPIWKAKTLEEAWMMIKAKHGFGAFLAYEVVTDLRYTRYLKDAPDIMTWANPGPGAKRGIYCLLGMSIKPSERNIQLSDEDHIKIMRELLRVSPQYLEPHVPSLEMRHVEHCCCEYFKYCRVRDGGRMRSLYRPPQEILI